MTDSVFSKPILPKSTKEDEEIQWKSPILIAGIIVAVIIFSVWIALAISRKNNQQAEKTNQPTSLIPGVKIDQQKVAETTGELSDADPKSSLLVMGSLRTTYSGLLANWYTQEATNPDDVALVLELNKGTPETTVVFELTKAELEKTRVTLNSDGKTSVIAYTQMEIGNGVAIS